jgi:hypothetical protein
VADVHVEGAGSRVADEQDEEGHRGAGRDETEHPGSEARKRKKNARAETRFPNAVELEIHR